MKIRIEDGKTIISTGVKSGDPRNKTGVKGLTYLEESGTYSLDIVSKGKKYHIGNYKTAEEGKAMRKKCDEYIENGTFLQWVTDLPNKRILNKHGVKGLNKKGNVYQMNISFNGKKYFLGSFATPEAAKPVREAAEKHIEDGTFEKWINNLSKKDQSNQFGVKGVSRNRNRFQVHITYKGKKFYLDSFDTPEAAKPVRAEAERQIEAGTFEEWIAELKKSRGNRK